MKQEQPIQSMLSLLKMLYSEIAANEDLREKQIADRVIVWDGSFSIEKDGTRHYTGLEMQDHECIVAETDCDYIHREFGKEIVLDLVVFSPKYKVKIRTKSKFVKLV